MGVVRIRPDIWRHKYHRLRREDFSLSSGFNAALEIEHIGSTSVDGSHLADFDNPDLQRAFQTRRFSTRLRAATEWSAELA